MVLLAILLACCGGTGKASGVFAVKNGMSKQDVRGVANPSLHLRSSFRSAKTRSVAAAADTEVHSRGLAPDTEDERDACRGTAAVAADGVPRDRNRAEPSACLPTLSRRDTTGDRRPAPVRIVFE